jgi:hypothetical protein
MQFIIPSTFTTIVMAANDSEESAIILIPLLGSVV